MSKDIGGFVVPWWANLGMRVLYVVSACLQWLDRKGPGGLAFRLHIKYYGGLQDPSDEEWERARQRLEEADTLRRRHERWGLTGIWLRR